MKRLSQIGVAFGILAMAFGLTQAQQQRQRQRQGGGGFGGGVMFLLTQESVQKELKLSDEQIKQVKELSEKQRESFQGLRDLSQEERQTKMRELAKSNNDAVAKILKPEQLQRAKQISLQQMGTRALGNEEVAKALNISEEQKDKIREIRAKAQEESRGLGRDEEGNKKRQEINKATNEKVMGVLTADQKSKLKEMQGETFTGKIERPQFGGGNRRNRQNQGKDKQS